MNVGEPDLANEAAFLPQYIDNLTLRANSYEPVAAIPLDGVRNSAFFLAAMQVVSSWTDKEYRHAAADLILCDMLLWWVRDGGAAKLVIALYDAMDKWYA